MTMSCLPCGGFTDDLKPPTRDIAAPLRIPIANVFKGVGSGVGVSGRLCGGVVQVGERLRILPGDETAVVKCAPCTASAGSLLTRHTAISNEETSVPWAVDGSNVTIYLTAVDPIYLAIGNILCPSSDLVPLATVFTARIITFDIQMPITAGTSVCLDLCKVCLS
jgi:elongation factor 1 alpha-like protein